MLEEEFKEILDKKEIEIVGKEYMLTAKVYEALKSDVEYIRDKTIQYIKAKNMIEWSRF